MNMEYKHVDWAWVICCYVLLINFFRVCQRLINQNKTKENTSNSNETSFVYDDL